MSVTFKVWVQVEQHCETGEEPEYLDVDMPFSCTADMESRGSAMALAEMMHNIGEMVAPLFFR